jgi:hypothetical protein
MPVVEREETHARTELGAAQKDTARELGAKLSSLKGIVWVGVGLFIFSLASLVRPPLKVVTRAVLFGIIQTTSRQPNVMIGGAIVEQPLAFEGHQAVGYDRVTTKPLHLPLDLRPKEGPVKPVPNSS